MSARRAKLVLLCEDNQHEAFLRRFFERVGWDRSSMRVQKSPKSRGSGEQWVRERFPVELAALRRRHVTAGLVAMIDADRATVAERVASLDAACRDRGIETRKPDEPVAVFVPRRNIETWIAYLDGLDVDESNSYPKLPQPRKCDAAVRELKQMCDGVARRVQAPPSLADACEEYTPDFATFRSRADHVPLTSWQTATSHASSPRPGRLTMDSTSTARATCAPARRSTASGSPRICASTWPS